MRERALVLIGPWTDQNLDAFLALRLRFGLAAEINFHTLVITGALTDEHIKGFVELIQAIEKTNPAATYNALIVDPKGKQPPGETMQLLDRLMGPVEPGRERTMSYQRFKRPRGRNS